MPDLLRDLALILGSAGVVTVLFKWLRQPVVLGYILAGIFLGPHVSPVPLIKDVHGVQVWAEAGVIFLLFGLGLEFSFRKLARVGAPASVTAIFEVFSMMALGILAGHLLGWSTMDSLFLGGILSISSTTIIIRALDELKMKRHGFAHLVFGVLIIEDLVAVILLVLLSTVAVTKTLQGTDLIFSMSKLFFFLVLWFVGGIFVIPSLLRMLRGHLSDEVTLILSLALCLLMVLFATHVGFSPALGAFIMGSILAGTPDAERIERITRPVKDLFAAIFFVSVGMLFDPATLVEFAIPLLVIILLTIVGKILSSSIGALVAARPLRQSIQAGFCLAQIGEFSFIIATLGLSLKVTSEFLYPIAVAVSAVTAFTTPYLIRSSDHFYNWFEAKIPERWHVGLVHYHANLMMISSHRNWRPITKALFLRIVPNGVLITAVFLGMKEFVVPMITNLIESRMTVKIVAAVASVLVSSPFWWAMAAGRLDLQAIKALSGNPRTYRTLIFWIQSFRVLATMVLLTILIGRMTQSPFWSFLVVLLIGGATVLIAGRLEQTYDWFEARFLTNLDAHEEMSEKQLLAPWDAHLVELQVEPNCACVGRSLMDLQVRERFGVTIVLIRRGSQMITAPNRFERLYPGDRLMVLGTDEEILNFTVMVQERETHIVGYRHTDYRLERLELWPGLKMAGQSIRHSGIREMTQGLVVGLERQGQRLLNPDSTLILEDGDILWIVGDPEAIRALRGR